MYSSYCLRKVSLQRLRHVAMGSSFPRKGDLWSEHTAAVETRSVHKHMAAHDSGRSMNAKCTPVDARISIACGEPSSWQGSGRAALKRWISRDRSGTMRKEEYAARPYQSVLDNT
jgi:hypothetical protein